MEERLKIMKSFGRTQGIYATAWTMLADGKTTIKKKKNESKGFTYWELGKNKKYSHY